MYTFNSNNLIYKRYNNIIYKKSSIEQNDELI